MSGHEQQVTRQNLLHMFCNMPPPSTKSFSIRVGGEGVDNTWK